MDRYVGPRDIWNGEIYERHDVYVDGKDRMYFLDGPGSIKEDVVFNRDEKRLELVSIKKL